jgi:flagellar hook-basal body protein
MTKLPIVLMYQAVPPGTPTPPVGTTAGTLVKVNYTDMTTTAATPTQWFVQKVNVNFGTVSTLTGEDLDPDDDGILGSLTSPDQKTEITQNNAKRDGLTQDATGTTVNGVYTPHFTARLLAQDGRAGATLQSVSVDVTGRVVGSYNDGTQQELAQLAVASFANPGGLARVGDNHFAPTSNSGAPEIGTAGTGDLGTIEAGTLEQSNVDLLTQMTNMMIGQRSFEANARMITASDRVLDTLINLTR